MNDKWCCDEIDFAVSRVIKFIHSNHYHANAPSILRMAIDIKSGVEKNEL